MITLEKLQLVKVKIKQLDVYYITLISMKYYKLIEIDLTKQQKLDADPKAIQQIKFTAYQNRAEGAIMFLIIEETKGTFLDFSKGTVKGLNVELSSSQLNKLESGINDGTEDGMVHQI